LSNGGEGDVHGTKTAVKTRITEMDEWKRNAGNQALGASQWSTTAYT